MPLVQKCTKSHNDINGYILEGGLNLGRSGSSAPHRRPVFYLFNNLSLLLRLGRNIDFSAQ